MMRSKNTGLTHPLAGGLAGWLAAAPAQVSDPRPCLQSMTRCWSQVMSDATVDKQVPIKWRSINDDEAEHGDNM